MMAENKKIKIALFILEPLTQGGGAEKYFINLANNLSTRGVTIDIITMDDKFFRKFARLLYIFAYGNFFGKIDFIKGVRETRGDVQKKMGTSRWIETSFKNLRKTLSGYSIVYSQNELVDLFLLKIIGYRKLPPIIVGVHTPIFYPYTKSFISKLHNFLYRGFVYRWLLRGVKLVHLSNRSAKELTDRIFTIKNQLIYYPFSAGEMIEQSKIVVSDIIFDPEKINIIFVARLTEQKGISELAAVINELKDAPDIKNQVVLNIFGSGDPYSENIVRDLEKKYVFVKYFGHIENKYIPNILSRQNLFITTAKWETLPFNVLEAQAMGLPVIAFDIPGSSDIIINGQTGFLVKNEQEFVKKIIYFIEKKDFFNREEIIKNIKNKFEPNKIYSELLMMFKENL